MICFCGIPTPSCFAQTGVTLETQPWPAPKECEICVPVQFGKLETYLPLSELERILIIDAGGPVMHVIPKPKSGSPKIGFQLLSLKPDKLMALYKQSGLLQGLDIKTNEQLFDILGKLPENNKSLEKMRRLKDIDKAKRYIKTSKDNVHAYWIKSALPEGSQRIYFVIDGEEDVYLLAGDVTRKIFETVLSNLHVVDIP